MNIPKTHYARSDDVQIAYQVIGDGPTDLLLVPGFVSNVESMWRHPESVKFLMRLASFCRLIVFDKRGTGMSDRGSELFTLEQRMHDVHAVLDAVGSKSATLFGISEGGPMSLLFSATYPERTKSLILYGAYSKRSWSPDYPFGWKDEQWEHVLNNFENNWGTPAGVSLDLWAPSIARDPVAAESITAYFRSAASPGAAVAIMKMNRDIDVRAVLPSVHVPTLILHRTDERVTPVESARYLAEHIPNANLVEMPGQDHTYFLGNSTRVVNEIEMFVTGHQTTLEPERVLTTVLFVDIVGSTERAVSIGDRDWRALLDSFYAVVREQLARHRGSEIDNAGDGIFTSFGGPAGAIRCAQDISSGVQALDLSVRCGVHTGECEVIGQKLTGIAVHTGARISALANPGEVLVSRTVRDLVAGSGIQFEDRGEQTLKGIPGQLQLFQALPS